MTKAHSLTFTRVTEPGILKMPSSFRPVTSMCLISCTTRQHVSNQ